MNKALFLDRDGVINVDYGYIVSKDRFVFCEGIFELSRLARDRGFKIVVVTNQSGIARAMYSEEEFKALTRWMLKEFSDRDAPISGVYYCPHAPEDNCECRKPKSGMFRQAIDDFHIDPSRSWMIGDKTSDMEAAIGAGVKNLVLLGDSLTGNTELIARRKNLLDTIVYFKKAAR
ncbi:MAG: D-glycero-beta-D-manno-heptose 1,7-bisphosphate 7-phosphatase [Helicobacteraceae bacterium]|jgi:D-glycero-D-manno-heptose 1,7-bisphosphate phosphatase|nr:D-glycero-beta-D-manno-heptose 1,7-bisphosphate 7-phosphatase [Helicobacteraceae bacterium]